MKLIRKFPHVWKLRNMHLNDTWIKDEIITEIGKYFNLNDNEIMIYKNLLDLGKAVLKVLKYKEYN